MLALDNMAVEWLVGGGLVVALGALIRFAGWTWLVAGYHESTSPLPGDVVRVLAGNTILRIGFAGVLFGIVGIVTDPPPYLALGIGAVILVDVLRLVYRLNTDRSGEANGVDGDGAGETP